MVHNAAQAPPPSRGARSVACKRRCERARASMIISIKTETLGEGGMMEFHAFVR